MPIWRINSHKAERGHLHPHTVSMPGGLVTFSLRTVMKNNHTGPQARTHTHTHTQTHVYTSTHHRCAHAEVYESSVVQKHGVRGVAY